MLYPIRILLVLAIAVLGVLPVGAAEGGLPWNTEFEAAKSAAAKDKKLIFMDIYAEWCPPCKMLDAETFPDPEVQKALSDFVLMKVDADKQMELVEKYSDGSLPTLVVMDADGAMLDSTMGFLDPKAFVAWLSEAKNAGKETEALEAKVAASPDDAEAVMMLANRYLKVRQGARAAATLDKLSAESLGKLSPENRAQFLFTRAMAHYDAGNYGKGVAALREFREAFPDDPRALDAAPQILQGVYMQAKKDLREGNIDAARNGFEEVATDESIPGAADVANMELNRIEKFGKPGPALDVSEWAAGQEVDIASLKGRVVLLDFFQVSDPGTELSRPSIEGLLRKYGSKGLEVVGIAMAFDDHENQTPDIIKVYVKDHEYMYPVAIDKDMVNTFLAYAGMGSPWTALLDKEGKIVYLDFFDEERVSAKLDSLLSEAGA